MKKIPDKTIIFDSFKSLYAFGEKMPIDLSLSENPLGFSPKVKKALSILQQFNVNDYPDPKLTKLKKLLAQKYGLSNENFFISNGSESIIRLLPQLLNSRRGVIIPEVTFPMFEVVARLNNKKIDFSPITKNFNIDLEKIKKKVNKNTKMIFLCNPNNPTGRIIPKKKLLKFIKSVSCFVIVDEANIEFGGSSIISSVKQNDNLILIRTFSKGYGLAGLRVGFAVACEKIIQSLERINPPFPVSTLSEKLIAIALSDDRFITETKKFMNKERNFLSKELEKRGFKVIESRANNLLVDVSKFNKSGNFIDRLNNVGISVVKGSSFRGLNDNFIRITPRLRNINREFLIRIDRLISSCLL